MTSVVLSDFEQRLLGAAPPKSYFGHAKKISALAWSPTGHLVATGSADTTLRTWGLDTTGTCKKQEVLRGHTGTIDAVAWNPNDIHTTLASGATDGTIRFWDTRSGGKQTSVVTIKKQPLSMAWKIGPGNVHTPSTTTNTSAVPGSSSGATSSLIIPPTTAGLGQSLPSSSSSSSLLPSTAASSNGMGSGDILAIGTREDQLIFIDARKNVVAYTHQFPQELNEFAFTPSGLIYAALGHRGMSVGEGLVAVYTVGGGSNSSSSLGAGDTSSNNSSNNSSGFGLTEVARARGHTTPMVVLRFDPTYRYFASGAGDSVVCLWDAAELAVVRTFDRAESQVRGVSFSPFTGENLTIAAGDRDDPTKYLDCVRVADGTRIRALPHRDGVNFLSWAPHANLLAYAADDGKAVAGTPAATETSALRVLVV